MLEAKGKGGRSSLDKPSKESKFRITTSSFDNPSRDALGLTDFTLY